ncbi:MULTISPECIES: TonB-dependent receptor [unclassified Flavobacterium]|uniref:TonB-dependent receptor n=1 Tax=unclassified Flavobacterium TaxID=196869 RepID=UPI0026366E58|nr:TonB-dependent receptor [Flavobacterium sp.]
MNNTIFKRLPALFRLTLFGYFLGMVNLLAQTGTVSVDYKNASPKEIIENLESRTPYRFIYQNTTTLNTPRITLKKENVAIDVLLGELQQLTTLNFRRNGNNIAVHNRDAAKKKKQGITGRVVDGYGAPLYDAMVLTQPGAKLTFTDNNGDFVLDLEPGNYAVEISAQEYTTQLIENVPVQEGQTTPLNVALKSGAHKNIALNEVVISVQQYKSAASTEGLLRQQRKAAQFSDGISAEQISRTPDNDVGSTLKRITGITTVDDKYVVVRSMGERWNQAVMDGVNLPSTDAQQQNFAFDIIPTAMVESVVVSKTATPDMNANFAGGYVEVKTKDIPREDFTSITVGNSYNSRSTFKEQLSKQRGRFDYLGFDDGTRSYPSLVHIPTPTAQAGSEPFFQQSRQFTQDNFSTYKNVADPGMSLQFALGRAFEMKDNNRWGFVGSIMFRNTQTTLDIDHTERGTYMHNSYFTPETDRGYSTLQKYGFKNSGASYNFNSTLGGMLNAGIQLKNNRITMRNTLLHIYDNQLTQITGWNYYGSSVDDILNGTDLPDTEETNYPVFQTFLQNKIEGNHRFNDFEVNWFGAYSRVDKDTRDATFLTKFRKRVGDDILLYHQVYNPGANIARANFSNSEDDYNVGANINRSFSIGSVKNDIKAGYFGTYKRATNFQERSLLKVVGQGSDRADVYYPLSELLDGSHYYYGGFGWEKLNYYGSAYEGEVITHAPFLMLDHKFGSWVRVVWGMRAESYVYKEISSQSDNAAQFEGSQKDDKVWQYLPSVNVTISPNSKTNIRLGYSKTVMRPQFSERLKIPYFDPVRGAKVLNWTDGIVSSVSENYDLKYEWFPSFGQIMSVGLYHKNIQDPIEAVTVIGGDGGSRSIYNMNSHSAKLWGLEAEILKNLSFLGEGKALEQIYLYANAAINKTKVTSYVKIDGTGGLYEADRPLFGQSPYTYNLGLDYIGDRLGFSIRHNATGDQYILVGFDYDAEEIRLPYAQTDVQVSCKFLKNKNLELKCNMKNLFDSPIETYNNKNSYSHITNSAYGSNPRDQYSLGAGATNRYDENIDRKLFKAFTGRTISVSLNYSF